MSQRHTDRQRGRESGESVIFSLIIINEVDKYFHQKSLSFNSCRITPEATFYVLAVGGPKMLFNLNFLEEHVLRFRETILLKIIWLKVTKMVLHFFDSPLF